VLAFADEVGEEEVGSDVRGRELAASAFSIGEAAMMF
jgi:hypothetical protein